jgi:hypothetical protein
MSNEQITETNTPPVEETTTQTPSSTETKAEDTLVSSTTNNTIQTSKSWKETISEEYRNDPNISKFTEIDALAKSYINATKMIGADKITVPTNSSTEEHWEEVYSKLGRPESADKYKLDFKSETAPIDEGAIKSFAEVAHKTGLNERQAQAILDFYKANSEQSLQQSKIDTETAQANAEQQLRKEWGGNFDANIKRAGAIAKQNMNPEILDMQLKDGTRLGDHPDFIKGFANIANLLSEDKFVGTGQDNDATIRDYDAEIKAITEDLKGPFWNSGHPDHDKLVQQVLTLRTLKANGQ